MTASLRDNRLVEASNIAAVADRRRSPRRRLHQPSEVVLRGTGADHAWTAVGTMLNVSEEGIACRTSAQTAQDLAIGRTLHVVFSLPPASTVFDLQACIINITPAGTSHNVVLGMQFVADQRLKSFQAALLESLRRAGDEINEG